MFGIKFVKTRPTDYVLLYKRGKIKAQGPGLSFFHFSLRSNIVIVPADSRDVSFIFKEVTADFQELDVQGQLTYRVTEPARLASVLDFTVDARGNYLGDGIEKLPERITNTVQVTIREKLQGLTLVQAMAATREFVDFAQDKFSQLDIIAALGIEVIDFSITRLSPTPDMARALEAATRETLLKQADQAIYERRNFAVEQERIIKENELQTDIAVEEKNRQIREEKMNAEIAVQEKQKVLEEKRAELKRQQVTAQTALEEERRALVKNEAENEKVKAQARSESLALQLAPLANIDARVLEALVANQLDSTKMISRALGELVAGAEKIGTLNLSPELLQSLMSGSNVNRNE